MEGTLAGGSGTKRKGVHEHCSHPTPPHLLQDVKLEAEDSDSDSEFFSSSSEEDAFAGLEGYGGETKGKGKEVAVAPKPETEVLRGRNKVEAKQLGKWGDKQKGPAPNSSRMQAKPKGRGRPPEIGLLVGERLVRRFIHKIEVDVRETMEIPATVRRHIRAAIPPKVKIQTSGGLLYGVRMIRDGDVVRAGEGWDAFAAEFAIAPGDTLLMQIWSEKWWKISVFAKNGSEKTRKL
ncbi:uncharacterized protein LOC124681984 [Lolium rigidum]|uniref:uncharacterized protein LOC124681984 n=1 Tax=Lolium rigidum TaxID=89674 RepID=UPI001F5D5316|nr:uncharacterized protein LOC124681984 [Lolium rigidum]